MASGYPFRDRNVNFRWFVRQGRGSVGPIRGLRDKYPTEKGYGELVVNPWLGPLRTEVLVFARYGKGAWGPPSVISLARIPNEIRQYDRFGRILSVKYAQTADVMPSLYQNKPWSDAYIQDPFGNIIGFLRKRNGEMRDVRYSAQGEKVLESYASDLPKETAKVRYFTRPDDPMTLDYEETSETVHYPDRPFVPRTRGEFPPPLRKKR